MAVFPSRHRLLTSGGSASILHNDPSPESRGPRNGRLLQETEQSPKTQGAEMAKYLQCSECGKLAFYYDDYVGTEKPFYKRFMRYPEGETKYELPRCFNCGGVPRLIHEFIKEEKAAAKH
jgi:hypothetical protein